MSRMLLEIAKLLLGIYRNILENSKLFVGMSGNILDISNVFLDMFLELAVIFSTDFLVAEEKSTLHAPGQILGQFFDQILARFLGSENTVYSSTGTENTVQSYWDRKRLHANYYCLFRAYQKNRLPAIY